MIRLGLSAEEKDAVIQKYCAENDIDKVVLITPKKFSFTCTTSNSETVLYEQTIKYVYFYRLLREIDKRTLIVLNECLRTQDRSCLTYNCIRHYLQQTGHQIVFQYLPLIDTLDDFMILVDFDSRSRWRRESFDGQFLKELDIAGSRHALSFSRIEALADEKTKTAYQKEKHKLFASIGLGDPHTLPRRLHDFAGRARVNVVKTDVIYLMRNSRFKNITMRTYKEDAYPDGPYTVFDFCHNFIDFCDVTSLSGQDKFETIVSDMKADVWYFDRYSKWSTRIADAYAEILR